MLSLCFLRLLSRFSSIPMTVIGKASDAEFNLDASRANFETKLPIA
jgi:hypothetical protein